MNENLIIASNRFSVKRKQKKEKIAEEETMKPLKATVTYYGWVLIAIVSTFKTMISKDIDWNHIFSQRFFIHTHI